MLRYSPANDLTLGSLVSVMGARDTLVGSVHGSLVQGPRGFEDPESLNRIMEDAQVAAVLGLKSEYAVSLSFSL